MALGQQAIVCLMFFCTLFSRLQCTEFEKLVC